MSILDEHEEHLAISLESTDTFGVPLVFTSPDGLTTYNLTGQLNIISKHSDTLDLMGEVTMVRANCTVRSSSMASAAGYPGDVNWADKIPAAGWKVDATKTAMGVAVKFLIEKGSLFPDDHLGTTTYFLAGLEIIT
jgi:hypothetical protein